MSEDNNVLAQNFEIGRSAREAQKNQKAGILWFTGLSGSGKSTTANAVDIQLFAKGRHTYVLDGDNVRGGLNRDLGFADADRIENVRRIAEVARLMADAGLLVLVCAISPFHSERAMVRELIKGIDFVEIYLSTPIEMCEQRDPKGLYRRARAGTLKNFTGIDSRYEPPVRPDVDIDTSKVSVAEAAEAVMRYLRSQGIVA